MKRTIGLVLSVVALSTMFGGVAMARGNGGGGPSGGRGGGGGPDNPASGPSAYADWRQQWAHARNPAGAQSGWLVGQPSPSEQATSKATPPAVASPNG
jgi:hypothetical protein